MKGVKGESLRKIDSGVCMEEMRKRKFKRQIEGYR